MKRKLTANQPIQFRKILPTEEPTLLRVEPVMLGLLTETRDTL